MIEATTEWDDDRILGRVETRTPGSDQQEVKATQGLVVRLYDRGPATGRADDPKLLYDSERAAGFSGVFDKGPKAERFCKRVKAAHLAGARWRELVQSDRTKNLPKRLDAMEAKYEDAKAEAKEANGRAKAATKAQRKLWQEAEHPRVLVECPPGGKGFTISLAPSQTNGPRSVVLASVEGAAEQVPLPSMLEDVLAATEEAAALATTAATAESTPPAPKAKLVDEPAPKLPKSVPGKEGPRLKAGILVTVHEVNGAEWLAEVDRILRQDEAGTYWLEVYDSAGIAHDVEAQRCVKARRGDHPAWVGRAPDEPTTTPAEPEGDGEPPAEPPRPGIDPNSIKWPEDEKPADDEPTEGDPA